MFPDARSVSHELCWINHRDLPVMQGLWDSGDPAAQGRQSVSIPCLVRCLYLSLNLLNAASAV